MPQVSHSGDPEVNRTVERYLGLADTALPGRIAGLYLVGSIALGDYRPGRSDIDFVAVTGQPLTERELDQMERLHHTLQRERPRPFLSGIYVTWSDLARHPGELAKVPFHHEGRFRRAGAFEANPVVWQILRSQPTAIRGPATPSVWHDPIELRRWTVANLNSYWQGLVTRHRHLLGRGALLLRDNAVTWCVSGVVRLHFTIATGDIISKSGACRYALATFPEPWHPLITEALAIREGSRISHQSRLARRRETLDFVQMVIDKTNAAVRGHGTC